MEQDIVLIGILVAAAAIVATRLLGLVLVGRLNLPPYLERCLEHTPGTMLTALIVPDLIEMGTVGLTAAIATVLIAIVSRNMLAAVFGGAGSAAVARYLLSAI